MEARLNGLKFFYTDTGILSDRPSVFFLHGFPFDHTMWDAQVTALKSNYRVITYDQRGHGQTDVGDGQYNIEIFVDDFFALMDYLHISKAVIAGLSMGGYAVLRAYEREPNRFQALILCDTQSDADTNEAKLKRTSSIKMVKSKGVSEFTENFLKAAFAPGSFHHIPNVVDQIRQVINKTSPLGICGTLLALAARTDTTSSLTSISIPTLILVGEEDAITPPAAAQAMHSKISEAQFFSIPLGGHLSNLENPAAFNGHLLEFLKQLPS